SWMRKSWIAIESNNGLRWFCRQKAGMSAAERQRPVALEHLHLEADFLKPGEDLGPWHEPQAMHFVVPPVQISDLAKAGNLTHQRLIRPILCGGCEDGPAVSFHKGFAWARPRHSPRFRNIQEQQPLWRQRRIGPRQHLTNGL